MDEEERSGSQFAGQDPSWLNAWNRRKKKIFLKILFKFQCVSPVYAK